MIECQICGEKGHIAVKCYHRSNYSYQPFGPPVCLTSVNQGQPHVIQQQQNYAAHYSYQARVPTSYVIQQHMPDLSYQMQPPMQGMSTQASPSYSNTAN